jgi:serine phosphatase RsbU (regulator of sigma subunit)
MNKRPYDNSTYEKRVEDATKKNYFELFPDEETLASSIPNAFIINRPMSGVGGDGYWLHEVDDSIFLAVFDCMGHGHLASMMTRIYTNALKKAILNDEETFPNRILYLMHEEIKEKFGSKEKKLLGTGADMGIVKYNPHIGELDFAGAKMNLYEVSEGELNTIKADRLQIGELFEYDHQYKTVIIDLKKKKATNFYLFSDGVTDLVGGPNNKKLGMKNLKALLEEIYSLPITKQKDVINDYLDKWSGSHKPLDDALIIGFSLPQE